MMILETKPTRQQLDDRSFWDGLPPEGVICEGLQYIPMFAVLRNGEPIDFRTDTGVKIVNSFSYEDALGKMQYLSKDQDNITIKIAGYFQEL